jgi:hypothetical protein
MRRGIVIGIVLLLALGGAGGGLAAERYLITSPQQIKPGAIGYANLGPRIKRLIARHGGPRGQRGRTGARGPSGANDLAEVSGLVAWSSDPGLISTARQDSSGTIHGGSVWLNRGDTVHWLAELLTAGGSGMTHGAFAIYDSRLRLVVRTADAPKAFQGAPAPRWVKLSLTHPYRVPVSGRYYLVDFLAGAKNATIGVVVYANTLAARNVLPSGIARAVRQGPGLAAFPAVLKTTATDETRCIVAG